MTDHPSSYYLQKLDCNCNDCWYMNRDLPRYNQSVELHLRWQREAFENAKQRLLNKAKEWEEKGNKPGIKDSEREECKRKARNLRTEANAMRLQQDKKEAMINYGHCTKFDKPVSFMPGILQLDTQECFEHRKDRV